ncbi:GerAB/ArcD/ProY family transporter [Marinisporobacter balticus]|uniref:Spore germination protein n=1 Tax=Marinisporobacter balticus TaxID=2018667 RepID=A0A4R2L7S8_9FIRM|nr:endospore germination permease [Marinisporobacter balticus]TCO78738.1 spore germination protein [Marinisporobacter balticus]
MERNNDQISSVQLGMILSVTIIGVGILTLPRVLTEAVGPDGWIVLLIGGFMTLVIGILMAKLVKKFPQKSIEQISSSLIGKFLGKIISIGFCIYLIILAAIETRICGEIVKAYLLLHTPIEILMITLLFTASYLARSGIEPIARMAQIIFPMVIVIAIGMILPVIPEIDLSNFLPVFKTPLVKILKAIPIGFFSFIGIELILIFSQFVIDKKNIKKHACLTVGMVLAIYMCILIVTVGRFGIIETTHTIWPSLEIFKTVDLPGAFIENIEIFIIAIWIFSVFMTLAGAYFGASLLLSGALGSKEQNYFVLPILPLIYYLALIPDNIAQAGDYMDKFSNYLVPVYVILLPILFLIISVLKKSKGGKTGA